MGIGELLRSEREKRGLSLSEAESILKIRAVYIEALEEERFEDIPAEVYRIGYLKSYARLLGLDCNELVARYKTDTAGTGQGPENLIEPVPAAGASPIADPAQTPAADSGARAYTDYGLLPGEVLRAPRIKSMSLLRGLAIAAVVLLLTAVGIGLANYAPPTPPPVQEQQADPPVINQPPATAQSSTFEIRLVGIGHCWANVRVDGVEAYTGTINPGDNRAFTARESIWMNLGYPKGVDVYYNGKKLPPLGDERPVKQEFTRDLGAQAD